MLTVKKIVSMFLVLAMAAALVAVPFSASASSSNIRRWRYFKADATEIYSSYNESTQAYGGKKFQLSGNATKGTVTYSETGVEGVTTDPVFNISSDYFLCNYNATDGVLTTKTNQVLNFNFEVYIPEGKLVAARDISITAGASESSGAKFTLTNASGTNYIKAGRYSTAATVYYSKNTSYILSADEWHDISIRISVVNGKIWYGMYYDGTLVGIVSSNEDEVASMSEIQLKRIIFNGGGEDTYIKNIRLDSEDYNILYDIGSEQAYVHFDAITVGTNGALSSKPAGAAGTVLQTSSNSTSQYYDSTAKTYKNVAYTTEGGALKVTLTPSATGQDTHALIQNFRRDVTSEFPTGTKYLQMYYDVKIPTGSENSTRTQVWRLGNDTSTTNVMQYGIISRIRNGKLTFAPEGNVQDALEEKSVSYDVASDKWYRVVYLLKVENNSDSEYAIHTEGYGMDLETGAITKVYEADTAIPKLTSGTDGFVLTQQRTDIVTPAGENDVVTYYDNIVVRVLDETLGASLSGVVNAVPSDEDYEFPIDIKNDNGTVTARYRDINGTTQQILLVGVDSNGNVLGGNVGSDVSNKGIVTATWTAPSGTKEVRAYVLNGDYKNLRPITAPKKLAIN